MAEVYFPSPFLVLGFLFPFFFSLSFIYLFFFFGVFSVSGTAWDNMYLQVYRSWRDDWEFSRKEVVGR